MSVQTPLLFSSSGPVATPPATLLATLLAYVQGQQPGYTANLPGSLVEDISSTDVGAMVSIDQARVDYVNNLTPYGANAYILNQQGAMLGIPQGLTTNGNVDVVFTGTPGFVVTPGWTIGDGTNQYTIQDGGVVGASGTSQPLYAVATNSNIFAIPPGTVTTVVTSVPSGYSLSVTNPNAGIAGTGVESTQAYRSRIMEAQQIVFTGTPALVRTLLYMVPGVSTRLVSVLASGSNWEIICGGGDPYQVAGAIYQAVGNPGALVGSQINPGRNMVVSIYDAPDSYSVTFVDPPEQLVTVAIIWNTTLPNFTASTAVDQYMITATQSYINSIIVGQGINLLVLTEAIQQAISPVLSAANLTTLQFAVTINGILTPPSAGTSVIPSDPESYFYVSPSGVTAVQG